MNVKKFTANSSREALRKVRDALGPDAVILSNRATENGVEILALANDDISSLAAPGSETGMTLEPPAAPTAVPSFPSPGRRSTSAAVASMAESLEMARLGQTQAAPTFASLSPVAPPGSNPQQEYAAGGFKDEFERGRSWERSGERNIERQIEASEQRQPERQAEMMQARMQEQRGMDRHAERRSQFESERMHGYAPPATASSEMMEMMQEIRAMRGMMETQLAELAWHSTQKREPQKAQVLRELLAAGFSPSLSRYLTEKLPVVKDEGEGMRWIKTVLERNIATMKNENEVLEKGGVFALVGPTGVGKTTSTAKLAARCVMRHGTEKLALITTDGYRIGGHEQLRIYGKILGVMVHSVKDEADLRIALRELRGKHTVLIDTVGVSQRDQMVQEQVAMLSGAGSDVQRLLCLNATSTGETLHEVVRAYQGNGLAGCIMTKLDEAATIGNVLDVVIRQKLNLYYLSNGQRVPEDLHLADRGFLLDRAFRPQKEAGAFHYQDSELPLIMANSRTNHKDAMLREVHLG